MQERRASFDKWEQMKKILIILTIFTFTTAHSQVKCRAIIDWKYLGTIDIYTRPNDKIIFQVKNDSLNEDFLLLDILDQTETYFFVSISLNSEQNKKVGWIKKADYIGVYVKHEEFPMDLTIYKDKKESDIDKTVIKKWTSKLLTIELCSDNWTYVLVKHNGQIYKGWIKTDKLCANSYTYCN